MKSKIIYIAPALSTFVKTDLAILSQHYRVIVNTYNWKKKHLVPFYMLHQLFSLIYHLSTTKSIVISFGGYWSLLPSLLGKLTRVPVFIILNGTDAAAIPPVNYGDLRKPVLRQVCKISYKMASMLLPVSGSLMWVKNIYFSDDQYSFQGVNVFFPKIKTKYKVIYNGCDPEFWQKPKLVNPESKTFIASFKSSQYILKGGDLIVEVAYSFPDCTFYIAGCEKPEQIDNISDNVIFLGVLSPEELRSYFVRSQYYLQLSIYEGFGCSLCEAMLCESIPIGSSVNIIPEIIGESGYILQKRNIELLKNLIDKALQAPDKVALGNMARKRIIDNYSSDRRGRELYNILERN